MLIRITQFIGLSFALIVVGSLLTGRPAQAGPQPPINNQPVVAAAPAAQAMTFDLCASPGTVTMPDGTVIDFWGYSIITIAGCDPAQLPGPVLGGIDQGDVVTINLTNNLPVPTSMVFPGQTDVTSSGGVPGLFTQEAAAGGGTVSYTFPADYEGIFLYESGTADQPQVAMGLHGALIVGDFDPAEPLDRVIVLSEIDPNLNADPAGFDLYDYNPTYWLMNGRAYPDTLAPDAPGTSQPFSSQITVDPGDTLYVRYVNAGGIHHTISTLGLRQTVLAREADVDPNLTDGVSEIIPSGQTMDTEINIPASAAGRYPLFSRQLNLTNGEVTSPLHLAPDGGGGMLTFIEISGFSVAALASATIPIPGGWVAIVSVSAQNSSDVLTDGAMISGSWSQGLFGTTSCVSGAISPGSGSCLLMQTLSTLDTSVTFEVTDISDGVVGYSPFNNAVGTPATITLFQP